MSDNDDEIVRRAVEGDEEAIEALLRQNWPAIESTLRIGPCFCGKGDIEDVMLETWFDVFNGIHRLEPPTVEAFLKWFTTIAHNNKRDYIDSVTRVKDLDPRKRMSTEELDNLDCRPSTPCSKAQKAERDERLRKYIDQLPPSQHRTILMYFFEGKSIGEIAQIERVKPVTIYARLARGRERLQKLLDGDSNFSSWRQ